MPLIPDEEAVLRTFETVIALDGLFHAGMDPSYFTGNGDVFEAFLLDVKRALINPGSKEAATLLRALARWDSLNEPLAVEAVGR